MGRKPTGRPRGRPVGTGLLGEEQVRVTARLPKRLYDKVEDFAARQHFMRGNPELASLVREALEHYLHCPHNRQPINALDMITINDSQPINSTEIARQVEAMHYTAGAIAYPWDTSRQTENDTGVDITPEAGEYIRQTENTLSPGDIASQTGIEPEERDSIEWRRWAVLYEISVSGETLKPGDVRELLEAVADEGLALSTAVVRADLEYWRKLGRVHRDEVGGYTAQTAPGAPRYRHSP